MGVHGHHFFDAYTSATVRKGIRVGGRRITPAFPVEFHRCIEVAPLNDTEADCTFSASDTGDVRLETMVIVGRSFQAHEIETWLGASEVERLEDQASDWWATTGEWQAYQDAADEYGDWLHDQRTYDD